MKFKQVLISSVAITVVQMATAQTFTNAELFNVNLIVNGNAETAVDPSPIDARSSITVPGWDKEGYFTLAKYMPANDTSGHVNLQSQGPQNRGLNLFAAAAGAWNLGNNTEVTGSQRIDLTTASSVIETGNVLYEVMGYFGSYWGEVKDTGELRVQFLDQNRQVLDAVTVGNVNPNDLALKCGLLKRQSSGKLPAKTRTVNITLALKFFSLGSGDNMGIADNVSFTLFSPDVLPKSVTVNPAVEILMPTEQGKTYQLQSIADLETQTGWINMGAPFQGDGTVYRIYDSCAPGKPRQFYRMIILQ